MAAAKVWAKEAEVCQIMEEELAAAARYRAVLAMAETVVEQDGGLLSKQKGWADGEQLACNHCTTRGYDCQVSQKILFFVLLLKMGR